MKNIVILLIIISQSLIAQNSVDYMSYLTTLTASDTDDYTEIKEKNFISINPNNKTITFTKLSSDIPIIMRFEYYSCSSDNLTYMVYPNKWSVLKLIVSFTDIGQMYISWLYAQPTTTMIIYGPIIKQ